jgi:hypothetical protein
MHDASNSGRGVETSQTTCSRAPGDIPIAELLGQLPMFCLDVPLRVETTKKEAGLGDLDLVLYYYWTIDFGIGSLSAHTWHLSIKFRRSRARSGGERSLELLERLCH